MSTIKERAQDATARKVAENRGENTPPENTGRTYEQYRDEFNRIDGTANWAKGDLLNEMTADARYGDETMTRLSEDTDTPVSTLYALAQVAEKYPENSRRLEIPWSVYRELVSDPQCLELIAAWPDGMGWVTGTVKDAKELARMRKIAAITENIVTGNPPLEIGGEGTGEEDQEGSEAPSAEGTGEEAPDFTVLATSTQLASAMKNALLFTSDERPATNGINLNASNGILAVQATDSASLVRQEIPCEGTADIFIMTADAQRVTGTMKIVEGFTVTGNTVTFHGRENAEDDSRITVGVPRRDTESLAAKVPVVLERNAGGVPYKVSAALLGRLAKAARNAGEDSVTLRFSGEGKALMADAGTVRMAVQPRRDIDIDPTGNPPLSGPARIAGKDGAGNAATSGTPEGTASPAA